MVRAAGLAVLVILGACSSPSGPANDAAIETFPEEASQKFDQSSQDKRCGPPPLASHPVVNGMIDNAGRAKSIAFAYFVSIHEKKRVRLPLSAVLRNGVWFVEDRALEPGSIGLTLFIEICQSNGAVLNSYATQ